MLDQLLLLAQADAGTLRPHREKIHLADLLEELANRWPADSVRTRRAGGSGLGLALGAAIAQAHGGQLTLVRRAEQGAVFQLRLPR